MAALMAVSTGICAYADSSVQDTTQLKTILAMVKDRIDIPENCTEFSYSKQTQSGVDIYNFQWESPRDSEVYGSVSCSAVGDVIISYNRYSSDKNTYSREGKLSALSTNTLYSKAVNAVKKLNPTVAKNIKVDADSVNMSIYRSEAQFSILRTKNSIPVATDRGSISLDKNTGELMSYYIGWHPKATFRKASKALSLDEAKQKYAEMIDIEPQYEIYYDWEQDEYLSRLVYVQSDYGEINAFTGNKSDFVADGFFGDETFEAAEEDAAADKDTGSGTNGWNFTDEEWKEITVDLPYASEESIAKLVKSNKYLTWDDGMVMQWSYLEKEKTGGQEKYYFNATFSNETQDDIWIEEPVPMESPAKTVEYNEPSSFSIRVDAQTGELLSYYYFKWDEDTTVDEYDLAKAEKLAKEIFKSFSPQHNKEYTEYSGEVEVYYQNDEEKIAGSYHSFTRTVNEIRVDGQDAHISFDGRMKLRSYFINYNDAEFASTENMLRPEQVMEKFWQNSNLNLYYKARTGKTVTKTVLVYGADDTVYADAFTGEQLYGYYTQKENDLSGIADPLVKNMAEILDDNGILISEKKFSETDAVSQADFTRMVSCIGSMAISVRSDFVLPSGKTFLNDETPLTRGDAMALYSIAAFGEKITGLKGIFKSPFTDVADSDENTGYYAIAYSLGMIKGTECRPADSYTYGDLITLVYSSLK